MKENTNPKCISIETHSPEIPISSLITHHSEWIIPDEIIQEFAQAVYHEMIRQRSTNYKSRDVDTLDL